MVKKYIVLFFLCSVFINNFSLNSMKLFKPITKKKRDLSEYYLPTKDTLKNLGVEESREIVLINKIPIDLDDYDQDYEENFKSLLKLKQAENSLDSGSGAILTFSFESEDAIKKFISKIYEIAKGLRTTILHILVELKCINNLETYIKFLERNKEDFDFDNIDACPQEDLTYSVHKNLTPLFYAVLLNDFEKAKVLIEQGASIYVRNKFGYSLLHLAIFHKNAKMVKLILYKFKKDKEEKKHIKFDILNDRRHFILRCSKIIKIRHTPLHFAVWRGNISVIDILLSEKELKINFQDDARQTPLHILVQNCIRFPEYRKNAEVIAGRLLENGANPKITDKNGRSPAYYLNYDDSSQLKIALYDGWKFFNKGWFG